MAGPGVACREIFDDNSQPSAEEITDYAQQIGIDPVSEGHLLSLAKDGLMQALPSPWKAYFDEKLNTHYYYNPETKRTQWEHPLDRVYKELVVKARTASEKDFSIHDDTCASVQELLTFEENSKNVEKMENKVESPEEDFSTDSSDDPSKSNHKFKKPLPQRPNVLTPLGRPFSGHSPLGISERKLSDLRASPLRRSVDGSFPVKSAGFRNKFDGKDPEFSFHRESRTPKSPFEKPLLFKQHSEVIDLSIHLDDKAENASFNPLQPLRPEKGISFSGKGSMFLKSNRADLPSLDTEKSLPFDGSTKSEPPKGILREKTFDMLERKAEKERVEKQQSSLDDDRKSVRFNLEQKEGEFSLSPSSNSSSDLQDKQSSIISNVSITRRPLDTTPVKISNENLADLPPRPVRNVKLAPIGKQEVRNFPKEPPLRPKMFTKQDTVDLDNKLETQSQASTDRSDMKRESDRSPQGKRLLKPPAGDFIKPNLFQKQFDKIADIIKPISLDTDSESEFKSRPRSPMIPQKNKISINLMESIESETSIESPDKEYANLDLNDVSEPIQPLSETEKHKFDRPLTLKLIDSKISSPTVRSPTIRIKQEKDAKILQLEANLEAELLKIKEEFKERQSLEEKTLREEAELNLKKLKEDICKEQEVETDKLKARLKEDHDNHKLEIEKAISNAQEQHKLSLQHVMDNITLKLAAEREDAVRLEMERQREEIDNIICNLEREHNENVLKLHDAKAEELGRMRQKLEAENQRSIREMREMLIGALEIEKAKQLNENKAALEKLKADHDSLCDEMRKDYRSEVERLRSQHNAHLTELRSRLATERESERKRIRQPDEEVTRIAAEKAQLEDKYKCLKVKYARLKTDVKMSIERRNKRREQSMTTGSETEKSNSNKAAQALEKSKELNEPSIVASTKSEPVGGVRSQNNNPKIHYQNDNENGTNKSGNNNNTNDSAIKERSSKMHLTVTLKNGNQSDLSSDQSQCKSPYVRDKSPIGNLRAENDRYKNSMDNELSIVNDTSLSQSESHTVSKGKNKLTVAFSSDVDRNAKKEKVKKVHAHVYTDKAATDYHDSSDTANSMERKPKDSAHGRSRKKSFTRLKSASTSRLNYSPKHGDRSCSPVENLRQQLRKLEELEDQFPDLTLNVDSTGYRLRYPFADLGLVERGVPELEFVAHRALVEREGVRRARASLRRRRAALRDRRRKLSTATNDQPDHTWQEERDLTDLEVSLHRTRALLGEKVIRLRHIEKTLRKMTHGSSDDTPPDKLDKPGGVRKEDKQDATLSDISSQSSGFSSTEAQSDTNIRQVLKREVSGAAIYEQSSEIINSLENLNTEIRDIWQVLNIQQRQNIAKVMPPGQMLYSDLNYPVIGLPGMTTCQRMPMQMSSITPAPILSAPENTGGHSLPESHIIPTLADRLQIYRQMTNPRPAGMATVVTTAGATVQGGVATSLVERTKDLRDWLKQQASL